MMQTLKNFHHYHGIIPMGHSGFLVIFSNAKLRRDCISFAFPSSLILRSFYFSNMTLWLHWLNKKGVKQTVIHFWGVACFLINQLAILV